MALRWIIAGGGTGGHVTLALALGEVVRRRGDEVLFVGSDRGLEARLVPEAGFELVTLPSRQVMGRRLLGRIFGVLGIAAATARARRELARFGVDWVISVGGYAALPAALAAGLQRIPLALVEPNAMPGRSNRLTARFARRIFAGFDGAARRFREALPAARADRVRCVGVPLREELVAAFGAAPPRRVPEAPFRLLVFGGSQGARQLNEALMDAAPKLAGLPLEVFHQTGTADRDRVAAAYTSAGVGAEVVAFETDMPLRYRWADLAISRAGALTVAELALAGLPSLLVPYPYAADDHQAANAAELETIGAAIRLEAGPDHVLAGDRVAEALGELLADPPHLVKMSRAAAGLARPDAGERIVTECAELLRKPAALGEVTGA